MKISLKKLSLIMALLGILLLLFLSTIEPNQISIIEITQKHLNKRIKIQGEITSIKEFKNSNFILLTLKDNTKEIDVLISNTNLNQTPLTKNQEISIIGKVQQYQNSLQIQAEEIIKNY